MESKGGGGGGEENFCQFLDLTEGQHPLEESHRNIIHSLVKPSALPLPGARPGQVWETPKRRSPECEFGEATAILKTLKLNPNAAVFQFSPPNGSAGAQSGGQQQATAAPPSGTVIVSATTNLGTEEDVPGMLPQHPGSVASTGGVVMDGGKPGLVRKLSASSAPFVPNMNIPIPAFPTSSNAQHIHINNLTANLNYHVQQPPPAPQQNQQQTGNQTSVVQGQGAPGMAAPIVSTGGKNAAGSQLPFTVNGAYINHAYGNSATAQQLAFQPPVVVYQDPNINHVYYPSSVSQQSPHHVQHNTPQQSQQQQNAVEQTPQKYAGSPIVSVKEKLAQPEEESSPPPQQNSKPPQFSTRVVQNNTSPQSAQQQTYYKTTNNASANNVTVGMTNSYAAAATGSVSVNIQQQQPVVGGGGSQQQQQAYNNSTSNAAGNNTTNNSTIRASAPGGYPSEMSESKPLAGTPAPFTSQQSTCTFESESKLESHSGSGALDHGVANNRRQSVASDQPAVKSAVATNDEANQQMDDNNSITFGSYEGQKSIAEAAGGRALENGDGLDQQRDEVMVETPQIESTSSTASAPQPTAWATASAQQPTSWANILFTKQKQNSQANSDKPMARIQPFSAAPGVAGTAGAGMGGGAAPSPVPPVVPQDIADTKSRQFGEFLLKYKLSHYSTSLLPAGLSNRSNWCFVNAILQALVACPPFYNLFKQVNMEFGVPGLVGTKTTKIQAILGFVKEFSPLETIVKPQKKEKMRKKEDIRTGACFEPSSVYKMLLNLPPKDSFQVIEGRQEDAEEFLTCLLNGLSDEMTEVIKMVPSMNSNNKEPGGPDGVDMEGGQGGGQDDDWQEVDARGKHCVTRRVVSQENNSVSPIQALALGMSRSSLRSGSGEISATLQPFFTLQLDIQHPDITSLNQALLKNFDSEDIEGYKNPKTNQVEKASRSLNLEELPSILILHMKRFVYDATTGGVQKTLKPVEFSVDLEIPKSVLSNETRAKFSQRQRQYKLFAVVYHNGREATKGHYVTDIYHTGYGCWLHCDDATVTETGEESVLKPSQTSTPYILFYRRCDTVIGQEKKEPKQSQK